MSDSAKCGLSAMQDPRRTEREAMLERLLRELADAVDEEQSSDPDMPSHTDTVYRLERAVEAARAALKARRP